MSGDNEAIQPVSGDVRRYVQGGYEPVGATPQQVITQSPDYDGMNRGFGMFLDLGNNYARGRSGGRGKQDYTGQYQVEMEDWASNPEYHNTDGTPNSKGREAARRIRVKYAPYVSGAEIRSTDQSVGSGYKESVDNALRESFIKQQASDYEAQNKAALDIVSRTHPEWSQLPLQQRIQLGNRQLERVNAAINLQNTIKTSNDPKVVNSAIDSISNYLIEDLSEETMTRMRTVGVTTKDRQELIDLWASVGVQNFGWSPQEAQINAIKIADGAMAHLREYQKDLIAQTEDEIKFTVNDAKLKLLDSDPKLLAYYAATNGQIPPDVLSNLIAGNVSFGSAYRTVENKDGTYSRQLIVTDKNIRNFGLNYGNEATASASLASVIPEIDEALRGGNSTPLLGLRNLPALGGIMQAKNKDEKFLQAKQQLANDFSIELANNARHYYKGGNEINEDVAKRISDVVNTASYLGYTNEECKDIVNNALLSLGMKPVKGAHTPEELDQSLNGAFDRLARGEVFGFKLFGETPGSQQEDQSNDLGIDVTQYMSGNNQMSEAPKDTEQTNIINDEINQMSVYETEGYKNFRKQILGDIRRGDIPSDEGQRRLNDYVYNFEYKLEPVISAFEVHKEITPEMAQRMMDFTAKQEQFRPHVYEDAIGGKKIGLERSEGGGNATIAYGKNLDANPLTKSQLDYILIDNRPLTEEEKNGELGSLLMKKGTEIPTEILNRLSVTEDGGKNILAEDLSKSWEYCKKYIKGFKNLDPVAQEVCADIAFNAGPGFFTMKNENKKLVHGKFIEELAKGNYKSAAWYLERYSIAKKNKKRTTANAKALRSISD